MIRLAFEQISQRLWPAGLNFHSSTGVITLILFLRPECEGEKGLCASSRAGLYRYRPLYSYSSMKKCNLKSPFYYHRRGFVIENKTDFNRSPCFMIIFIHVEGLFGLGRIYTCDIILYITHSVCAARAMLQCRPFNNKFVWVYLDEIFPTTNRGRPQRRQHIEFSIFLTCDPAGPAVGTHVARLSKWKISFPWGEFPSKQTQNTHAMDAPPISCIDI